MSHMTTVKTTRETLDRIRPYAVFRESWDTALNNALDMLDDLIKESNKPNKNPFDEIVSVKEEKDNDELSDLLNRLKD
jgi:hypothetical protein